MVQLSRRELKAARGLDERRWNAAGLDEIDRYQQQLRRHLAWSGWLHVSLEGLTNPTLECAGIQITGWVQFWYGSKPATFVQKCASGNRFAGVLAIRKASDVAICLALQMYEVCPSITWLKQLDSIITQRA